MCPMRLGKQGPRAGKAGKAGRGASQQRSPQSERQPAPAGDSEEGTTSQPVPSPNGSTPPHTCSDNHRLVARARGGDGGRWASNSQASSDLRQEPGPGSSNAESQMQVPRAKERGNCTRQGGTHAACVQAVRMLRLATGCGVSGYTCLVLFESLFIYIFSGWKRKGLAVEIYTHIN